MSYQASPEFVDIVDKVLGEIKTDLDPHRRELADETEFLVWPEAPSYYLEATGTGPGYILLGAYEDYPQKRISIFESSIKNYMTKDGDEITTVRQTLLHELFQHLYGMNHTRETLSMGMVPGYIVAGASKPCG